MNFVEFLAQYWYLNIAGIAVVAVGGYCVYVFVKKPTSEKFQKVTEWLLWAVTEAEKKLGSGTGQLKLRYVYNMFIEKFGFLSRIIPFNKFSEMVDDALEKMKKMLSDNKAVKDYVTGESK